MFTGDRSGDFLFAALFRAGVANQPTSVSGDDGLALQDVLIAATCHCAPPANKPLPSEVANCSRYLKELLAAHPFESVLCLGSIAWRHIHVLLGVRVPAFGHGAISLIASPSLRIVGSYHPSQQNTFTGKLTAEMFDRAIALWLEPAS